MDRADDDRHEAIHSDYESDDESEKMFAEIIEKAVLSIIQMAPNVMGSKRNRLLRDIEGWAAAALRSVHEDEDEGSEGEVRGRKIPRTVYARPPYEDSAWAIMLRSLEVADPTSEEAKLFRCRFRVPYEFFLQIVQVVEERGWSPSPVADVSGRPCISVKLKVRVMCS